MTRNALFQKISILSPRLFFLVSSPHPHPARNFSLASHFLIKIWAFQTPPLEICNGNPWGGYGYFLESHNRGNVRKRMANFLCLTNMHNVYTISEFTLCSCYFHVVKTRGNLFEKNCLAHMERTSTVAGHPLNRLPIPWLTNPTTQP